LPNSKQCLHGISIALVLSLLPALVFAVLLGYLEKGSPIADVEYARQNYRRTGED
jgi:hypothetical protein